METQVSDPPDLPSAALGDACGILRDHARCLSAEGEDARLALWLPLRNGAGLTCLYGTPTGRAEGPDPKSGAAGEVSGQLFGNFGEQGPQPR